MSTRPHRSRTRWLAAALAATAVLGVGCARTDDPTPAVTGKSNIGTPTPPSTAARATGTTARSATTGTIATKPDEVQILDYSFIPQDRTVPVGTTVTWTNSESAPPVDHWVKSADGEDGDLDSGRMGPGQQYSKAFTQAGTYSYFCNIHNFMKAKVVVQ